MNSGPNMTPAKLQTVEETFHAALDCEPGQLSAFLDKTCAGDEVLRGKVEALLASHQRAGSFIQTPVAALATRIVENRQTGLLIGQTIGHYKILKRIGAGGMGEVYLAEDTRLHRKVALKILPTELAANKDRMRRFEQEAQAAAALNHPNIAHTYEIGESGGVNFMAMEFVDGVTLGERIHGERTELKKLLNVINGDTNERE